MLEFKKNNIVILIILILVVISSIFLLNIFFKNELTVLADVNSKEEEPNNNGFALMLETENADGTTSYVESNSSTWPTDMKFNSEKSGCVDVNNNIIENALEYDSTNNIMNVSIGETAYCYVFFDIKRYCNDNEPLGECLIRRNNEIDSLNDNVEAGLYRYQGTYTLVNDNYICFGTSDKEECINDTDKYMYRIIGIDENGQIKVIKKTSIGDYFWHSDYRLNTTWPESDLYKGLNGIEGGYYTDLFVNNSTYDYMNENSNWYNKIAVTNWKYGDTLSNGDYNGETIYEVENAWTETVNAKIGLMYIHDYYYAYGVGGNPGSYSNAKIAWVLSLGCDWFISRYGFSVSSYRAWYVLSGGLVDWDYLHGLEATRPVFYLTSDEEFYGGTGTSNDPFILSVN